MLPERDRRSSQIGIPDRPERTIRSVQEHARKIAGIVGHTKRSIETTRPQVQDIVPIPDAEEMNAIASNNPLLARKKIDEEAGGIMGPAQRLSTLSNSIFPRGDRGQTQGSVDACVIAGDFQSEPVFQLVKG